MDQSQCVASSAISDVGLFLVVYRLVIPHVLTANLWKYIPLAFRGFDFVTDGCSVKCHVDTINFKRWSGGLYQVCDGKCTK